MSGAPIAGNVESPQAGGRHLRTPSRWPRPRAAIIRLRGTRACLRRGLPVDRAADHRLHLATGPDIAGFVDMQLQQRVMADFAALAGDIVFAFAG